MKNILSKLKIKHLFLILVQFLLVGFFMLQTNPLMTLPGRDSGFFMYAGKQILEGKLPYVDFWDSKGPGIFYINAFGLWLGQGRWGVWLLEYVFLLIASYLFYQSVARKWGHGAALFSNLTWFYGLVRVWEGGNLTEEYSLVLSFILLSYVLFVEDWNSNKIFFLTGVTLALSFLIRANNIGTQIALIATLFAIFLWKRQYSNIVKSMVWITLSSGTVFGLVSIYFLNMGTFLKMFEAAIVYNFFYSDANAQFSLNFWQGIYKVGLPAYLALSGCFALLYQVFWKRMDLSKNPILLLGLLYFPIEVFLSSISGKGYHHYYISWIPAIALLTAILYDFFSKHIFSPNIIVFLNTPPKKYLVTLLVFVTIFLISGAGQGYQRILKRFLFEREKGIERADPVASFISANTMQDDLMLVWGAYPGLNFLANRDSPTAYLFYPAYEKSPFLEQMSAAFFHDLSTNPPKMIVDASQNSSDYILSLNPLVRMKQLEYNARRIYTPPYQNDVFEFVENNYVRIEQIKGMDIYILKSMKK